MLPLMLVLMVSEGFGTLEIPLALIDTGCTRCMHGQFWREKFEEQCLRPRGLSVKDTGQRRRFTSAFGEERYGKVFEIPIGLGGHYGKIFSTETEGCDTPLLFSLASQRALGAVIRTRDLRMELPKLDVSVQLIESGRHLAVAVNDWADGELDGDNDRLAQRET